MTEKLRAHDFTPSETVRPRRRHKPWHVRLLLALVYLLWGWWTGNSPMVGIAP
jgi:hypothetical protein